MKGFLALLLFVAAAHADGELDAELDDYAGDARLFFVNFTSSLIQVNATLLAYGLIFLAIVGAAAVALYYLFLESQSSSSGYGSYGNSGYGQAYGQYARSNDNAPWEGINILQWIQVLQDMYQNFDYNDLDCQKRMICEVMKEPEYYGSVARKFKNGFQYAKYLELMNLPDEMRELLDEYLDANSRADQQKDCAEFFQCPFSIHDTMKRSEPTNSILN
jgi:hypothetical protein